MNLARTFSFFLMVVFLLGSAVSGADAQKRRRKKKRAAKAPMSQAVHEALGDLKWGMGKKDVLKIFVDRIHKEYEVLFTKARDAIEEDRLRAEKNAKIKALRKSLTKFTGNTPGYDTSFLRHEYTHNNGEEMFLYEDANSKNYYFFINNKLWKWYKAFDASVFAGQPFDQFAASLQGRFGKALQRTGKLGGEKKQWLEWQSKQTRARAIDENQFYGFYCLVFESKATLKKLPVLRKNRSSGSDNSHSIVDSVINDDGSASTANEDIVDRLTGKIRNRKDAKKDEKKDKK